jgi:hypothetical protein
VTPPVIAALLAFATVAAGVGAGWLVMARRAAAAVAGGRPHRRAHPRQPARAGAAGAAQPDPRGGAARATRLLAVRAGGGAGIVRTGAAGPRRRRCAVPGRGGHARLAGPCGHPRRRPRVARGRRAAVAARLARTRLGRRYGVPGRQIVGVRRPDLYVSAEVLRACAPPELGAIAAHERARGGARQPHARALRARRRPDGPPRVSRRGRPRRKKPRTFAPAPPATA